MSVNPNAIITCDECGKRWFVWEELSECPYCAIKRKANDRSECAICPHSSVFDGCCEYDSTAPRCESCGVPLVKHLGLTGTCAEKTRYLSLLRRVVELTRLTVERTPAGYADVAEFLREEEKRT